MRRRSSVICTLATVAVAAIGLICAPGAAASLQLESAEVSLSTPGGGFERQAGAHPDLITRFSVASGAQPGLPGESVRDVDVDLPAGLVGNAAAIATCPQADLQNHNLGYAACPIAAQIGVATVISPLTGETLGLFNLAHGPEVPALFGFNYQGVTAVISAGVRPGDYRITSGGLGISQTIPIKSVEVKLWGVPADPAHDSLREAPNSAGGFGVSSPALPVPFLTNPTSCTDAPSPFTVRGDSWENPGIFDTRVVPTDPAGVPFVFEGCEKLSFDPGLTAQPTTRSAGAPTGLAVDFTVAQNEAPGGLASSQVRKAVLTFPVGMSVSASSAAGLGACGPAEISLDSNRAPSCPDSAKIGTVKVDSPLLEEQLQGDVILAKQKDNPFGSLLAMYLAVKGPGFYLKLPGLVEADPNTGQLTASFSDTPQLPFERLQLELKSGPRAPLTTPAACGRYAIGTEITPWSGAAPVRGESSFTIDRDCGTGGFDPALLAGTSDPVAGGPSPFNLQVTREDGEQNISRIDATLPQGLLARLAGVPLCGDGAAVTGSCPAASQIGTTTVAAGTGPSPLYVPQPGKAATAVYLAGPYKGAPYSLVVKVPAQAGPFDLGTVAVRSGIYVDPVTTAVSVKSDALPQILQGIPIAYRDLRVEVSRPDFTLNPTSCDPAKVTSMVVSVEGKVASPSARFQTVNCERLGFAPKLALRLSGPTHRSAHPKLRAVLTTRKGDANIGRAQVTLPKTEFLENAHIQTVCTRVQFAAKACPAKSVYGYAKAWSPLLDRPLQGPVYLRSSNHELPDLVASLDGQIHVDLAGRIDAKNARIRNTFDFVPDAPVSKFVLTMQGGKKGLLVNNTELCKAVPRAGVELDGQNGKAADSKPLVKIDCGRAGKKRR